jgi:hypothetical protein
VAAAPAEGQVYAGQAVPVAGQYAVPYAPQPIMRSRVEPRLQTLGTFWCLYALYRVVSAAIAMLMLRAVTLYSLGGVEWPLGHEFGQSAPTWMAGLLPVVAVVILLGVALATFTGWSLLKRKPWGRTLSIVTAILALLKFPFGTALGIYTLWVMVPAESAMEWEAIAEPD